MSKVPCIIKSLKAVLRPYMPRSIDCVHFQSRLGYGIIFWGGDSESKREFKVKKKRSFEELVAQRSSSPAGKFLRIIESLQ